MYRVKTYQDTIDFSIKGAAMEEVPYSQWITFKKLSEVREFAKTNVILEVEVID